MSGQRLAPSLDTPRQVAAAVALWCEKTSDTPRVGARALMAGIAARCVQAVLDGDIREARTQGRRWAALRRYLELIEGASR